MITISGRRDGDCVVLSVADNGVGMEQEKAQTILTEKSSGYGVRNVNSRIQLEYGEAYGLSIESEPGKGTKVRAVFHSDHIDCPPWGDLPGTVALLITGNPEINVCFEYRSGETGYSISTNEIKEILDGVPLSHPKVMLLIKEMIKENIRS